MTILHDFDLTSLTTFHLPASTEWFAEYSTVDELREILADKRFADLPKLHIGGGSNLLFTKPFKGLILHSAMKEMSRKDLSPTESVLSADSGIVWDNFVRHSIDLELYGLENLGYIPGETGASAVQNVGAYGVEAKDVILQVEALDTATGDIAMFSNADCRYSYRDSMFKHSRGRYIVTRIDYRLSRVKKFTLTYGPLKELSSLPGLTARQVYDKVMEIRKSKLPDPNELGSAGSFFKNPVVDKSLFNTLQKQYPGLPHYDAPGGIKIPAGWLIENAGLKGYRIGGAEVYPKQCLVLVNTGNATADDVVNLYKYVRSTVKRHYGIELEPEANII